MVSRIIIQCYHVNDLFVILLRHTLFYIDRVFQELYFTITRIKSIHGVKRIQFIHYS